MFISDYKLWILFSVIISDFTLRKELAPEGSEFFPLREVNILKRDAFKNYCTFQ